jgi:hypothetical protein
MDPKGIQLLISKLISPTQRHNILSISKIKYVFSIPRALINPGGVI